MEPRKEFSIVDGLNVQARQLEFWKKIFKREIYSKLVKEIDKAQKPLNSGYDVIRGTEIESIIHNKLIS